MVGFFLIWRMQNETSCWDWVSAFLCRAQATRLVKLMVVVVGRTLESPLMWVPLWMCSEPEGSPLCACTHVSLCPVWWGILSCTLHCSLGPDRYVAWQVALYGSHRSCIYMTWSGDWGAELMLGRAARWGPLLHPCSSSVRCMLSVAAKLQLFLTLMRQELGFQTRSVC